MLIFSQQTRTVYVGCCAEEGVTADYICKLSFNSGWASRFCGIEFLPYQIKGFHRSLIYKIIDSKWVKEMSERRLQYYPQWRDWDKKNYHHFVISGHDHYVEVIAESFSIELISIQQAKEILPKLYLEVVSD